jgi:ABC-type dipeptide/oligopeptide/nickel transport system permease subunit
MSMNNNVAVILVCVLLATGCATQRVDRVAVAPEPQSQPQEEKSTAVEVAKGAGKGALGGAGVCALPAIAGSYVGPIGFAVGAVVTTLCLPFGVTIGAVAGAANGLLKASTEPKPDAPAPLADIAQPL